MTMNHAQSASSTHAPAGSGMPDAPCSLLRMNVGSDVLAVPISEVREILQVTRLTPLPRTPDFVRGVMNLRGSVVPVIDLAARLGRTPTRIGRRSCIVVVESALDIESEEAETHNPAFVVGLLVDAVFEVFDRLGHEIEAAPPLGTRIPAECLLGMTRAGGEVIGVLALNRVLNAGELAAAIAAHEGH
jgi:purine-binding chemotaxis protein CheW